MLKGDGGCGRLDEKPELPGLLEKLLKAGHARGMKKRRILGIKQGWDKAGGDIGIACITYMAGMSALGVVECDIAVDCFESWLLPHARHADMWCWKASTTGRGEQLRCVSAELTCMQELADELANADAAVSEREGGGKVLIPLHSAGHVLVQPMLGRVMILRV